MTHKLKDVVYETRNYWVRRVGDGWFEVYRSGVTHSTLCATYSFKSEPERALKLAVAEADRREVA